MNYDKSKFKIWTWKHPAMLHWVLNPGLAFNELILGQRVPKVTLIEKNSNKTLGEKTFVPCPHCHTIHAGLKWSNKTAFRNWFGLYCDNCGKTIPCLTNLTSFLILCITSPFWFLFKNKWKENWLRKQPKRYQDLDIINSPNSFEGFGWIKQGFLWGLFMFIFMTFLVPNFSGDEITLQKVFIGIPIWAVGGLVFGYAMKLINGRNKIREKID